MVSSYFARFKHVTPKRVSDFILEQLEEAIILKDVLPEEQLPPERELATLFKASRLAVREAIAELEEKGLIERRLGAKGGTFVLPLTAKTHQRTKQQIAENWARMKEMLEYRSIIEPEAARLAAARITTEQLAHIRELVEKSSGEDCTREMFRSLDVKFHLEIAHASGNSYIESAVRRVRTNINPGLDLMPYNRQTQLSSCELHHVLLEALDARDGDKASETMKAHVNKTLSALSQFVE
ncbi:FadR/GntR family transcriptional regulator [Paenibacillus eucommiae]|uniref:DNA-binding FadR family transcriptional regulator n=1 Tax=Paenibacillus eucommiae TaxID=1355755 RepID=A0ABS4IT00_9BACL|nr:FCD domain-containing protein [Paenibacillus eucommiae]MBP1990011.1 DNA-binding FadR family transcriptional regulator [Paenibacillus eucommiae]